MKEAAGEANMTVVTIIIIAAVVAIGTPIVTGIMRSANAKTECLNNGQYWDANQKKCVTAQTGA